MYYSFELLIFFNIKDWEGLKKVRNFKRRLSFISSKKQTKLSLNFNLANYLSKIHVMFYFNSNLFRFVFTFLKTYLWNIILWIRIIRFNSLSSHFTCFINVVIVNVNFMVNVCGIGGYCQNGIVLLHLLSSV